MGWVAQAIERLSGGRRAKAPEPPPPPTVTTQSSPGQIATLQDAFGADMAPTDNGRAG